MKESNLTFAEGFEGKQAKETKKQGKKHMTFDWDKAALIIKERLKKDNNLVAEAGLQGDWNYTGGEIFAEGKPTEDNYTYLKSNWATPTLIINDTEDIDCFTTEDSRFNENSKWDKESLSILGIELQ